MYKDIYFEFIVVKLYRFKIIQIMKNLDRIMCDNHSYINSKFLNNYNVVIAYREIAKKVNHD